MRERAVNAASDDRKVCSFKDLGCIPNAVLWTSANSHGWFLQVCQYTIQVDEERKVTCGLLCDLSCA